MELGSNEVLQLIVLGVVAGLVFIGAYALPLIITASVMVFLIPFQPVVTPFATANVILAYVMFIAILMRNKDIRLPVFPQFLLVLAAFLAATGMQHPSTWVQHGIYILNFVSAYLVLCIAYEWYGKMGGLRNVMQVLASLNLIVVIYCAIQWIHGPGDIPALFGFNEFRMEPMHFTDSSGYRLTGPFGSAQLMAEYLVISIFLLIYQILATDNPRAKPYLYALAIVNLIMLMRTGNRGSFLVFLASIVLFAWLLRKEIGAKRTLQLSFGVIVSLVIAIGATMAVTGKVLVIDRLANTEVESGVPDSRTKPWTGAWEEIKKRPFLGHGPRNRLQGEIDDRSFKHHKYIQPPHNLYLFLLFTSGMVGLIAFLIFLATPLVRCWRASSRPNLGVVERSFLKIGIVIMTVVFVDQIKIEFLRFNNTDYWHFLFAVFGIMLAACDGAKTHATEKRVLVGAEERPVMQGA